jgi:hypothetical protein
MVFCWIMLISKCLLALSFSKQFVQVSPEGLYFLKFVIFDSILERNDQIWKSSRLIEINSSLSSLLWKMGRSWMKVQFDL